METEEMRQSTDKMKIKTKVFHLLWKFRILIEMANITANTTAKLGTTIAHTAKKLRLKPK